MGLAGVYDIAAHYEHEAQRGVEHVSPMGRAAGGQDNFPNVSPTQIATTASSSSLVSHHHHHCPTFHLIHGETDTVVPISSSRAYAHALSRIAHPSKIMLTPLPNTDHVAVLFALMDSKHPQHSQIISSLIL